jgi:hypothetical protein
MTLTYIYAESRAVVAPIATFSEPHAYDLCERHSAKLTVPHGWSVEREAISSESIGPSEDDLMAIADAVREVARFTQTEDVLPQQSELSSVGRRGHLRAVPS